LFEFGAWWAGAEVLVANHLQFVCLFSVILQGSDRPVSTRAKGYRLENFSGQILPVNFQIYNLARPLTHKQSRRKAVSKYANSTMT
jgi:hypothetical protein